MEHEKPHEESLSTPEVKEVTSIDTLPEKLGYIETAELAQLKNKLIEAMQSGAVEEVRSLATRYQLLGEEVVSQHQGAEFAEAQIGLSLAVALIRRDAGRTEDYIEDLAEAWEYAHNMGYDDVAHTLEITLDQTVE